MKSDPELNEQGDCTKCGKSYLHHLDCPNLLSGLVAGLIIGVLFLVVAVLAETLGDLHGTSILGFRIYFILLVPWTIVVFVTSRSGKY